MRKRVKSQFIQPVRVQYVVPPFAEKSRSYLSPTATPAREDRLCRMTTARARLYSTKSFLSHMRISTQRLKTCKGRGGVVFRNRPGTDPVCPVASGIAA